MCPEFSGHIFIFEYSFFWRAMRMWSMWILPPSMESPALLFLDLSLIQF